MRTLFLISAAVVATAFTATPSFGQNRAPENMRRVAPALADYTDKTLFGDVWKRPGLSPRDRSLVTVSVLVATGKSAQLPTHVALALDNGVKPSEIGGLVTHLAFYTGWPNAVSAVEVVDRVFRERNVPTSALQPARTALLPVPSGDDARAARIERTFGQSSPGLVEFTNGVLFRDLWRRQDLTLRDRSLVTISALAANGDRDQLTAHYTRGIENGLSTMEIGEAITQLAFYAGWPKAMTAIGEFQRIPEGRSD